MKRTPRDEAVAAVREFLAKRVSAEAAERFAEGEDFMLITDGDDCWAFFLIDSDTTSYVHPDLRIEWYGTAWPDGECDPCGRDFNGDQPKLCPQCKAPTAFAEPEPDDLAARARAVVAGEAFSVTHGACVKLLAAGDGDRGLLPLSAPTDCPREDP